MKMIIAGSRSIDLTVENLEDIIELSGLNPTEIISGNAKGVDRIGEKFAEKHAIPLKIFKPNWGLGRGAGFINNKAMGEYGDALIAIYDGKSAGTKQMIDLMRKKGKIVYVYTI